MSKIKSIAATSAQVKLLGAVLKGTGVELIRTYADSYTLVTIPKGWVRVNTGKLLKGDKYLRAQHKTGSYAAGSYMTERWVFSPIRASWMKDCDKVSHYVCVIRRV